MSKREIALLKVRVNSIIRTLESADRNQKEGRISLGTSEIFNKIRKDVIAFHPELESSIPREIGSHFGRKLGFADASFMDLELACNSILDLLSFLEMESQ